MGHWARQGRFTWRALSAAAGKAGFLQTGQPTKEGCRTMILSYFSPPRYSRVSGGRSMVHSRAFIVALHDSEAGE